MRFKTGMAALAGGVCMVATFAAAQAADNQIVDVTGAGGQASFTFETWTDDTSSHVFELYNDSHSPICVETQVDIFVTTGAVHLPPGKPSSSDMLGVEVVERFCPNKNSWSDVKNSESDVLFEGLGAVVSDFTFGADADLSSGELEVQDIIVLSRDDDSRRVLDLRVDWEGTPERLADSVKQNTHQQQGGGVVNVKHAGAVRLLSASAQITVENPEHPEDYVGPTLMYAREIDEGSSSLWNTSSRRITTANNGRSSDRFNTYQAEALSTSSLSTSSTTATTCSESYWSGYWTWNSGQWFWTWVWNRGTCGWTVS